MNLTMSSEEREMVYLLASQLTGTCQEGNFRHEILVTNVLRRMHKTQSKSLEDYLIFVEDNPKEMPYLLSALTIHTTNWFREKPHYDRFYDLVKKFIANHPGKMFTMLSAACSTGEEVYSFGLVLESFRDKHPGFDYEIHGRDIDPVSVKKAQRCVYPDTGMKDIPLELKKYLLKGSGKTQGLFTVDKNIRIRCQFNPRSLTDDPVAGDPKFDYVVCRNVLIYFSPEEVDLIVKRLLNSLTEEGTLTVGHSEALDYRKFDVKSLGHSSYQKISAASKKENSIKNNTYASKTVATSKASPRVSTNPRKKYRVLVVDDSQTVRNMMLKLIQGPSFDAVGAEDAFKADEILNSGEKFDIITLDLHMPGKDGQTWLMERRKKGLETPVVIVSDANPMEAQAVLNVLGNGAQDYIEKKDLGQQKATIHSRLTALIENKQLIADEKAKTSVTYETNVNNVEVFRPELIVLGASTGGTEALVRTLKAMPSQCPPVVVVQHISVDFSGAFAARLAKAAGLELGGPGDSLKPGHIYLSVEDEHIGVEGKKGALKAFSEASAKVSSHRPSVDFLFDSVAKLKDVPTLAVLLTGMGKDGAKGLLSLKNRGCMTAAQDAESSIVWGMPGEATKLGAPRFVGTTEQIRVLIDKAMAAPIKKQAA